MAYPSSLDNLATSFTDVTAMATTHAAAHNNADTAINSIEGELGLLPKGVYATVRARLDTLELPPTNSQPGAAYTLVLADQSQVVELTNAAAVTVTVPPNASVAFPVGAVIEVFQYGAGQVTIAAGGGVNIRSAGNRMKLTAQYSAVSLRKRATDEWVLVGDTTL